MKNWKKLILITCTALMIFAVPVMAATITEKKISEFTHYKVGVLLTADGGNSNEFDQHAQNFHVHGTIPNEYNIVGIQKYKYLQEFNLWVWKLTGFLEVSQEELP